MRCFFNRSSTLISANFLLVLIWEDKCSFKEKFLGGYFCGVDVVVGDYLVGPSDTLDELNLPWKVR